ncbi:MAG: class I SAM-dependent methyltransferase [Paracoccaceae bacterium]
MAVEYPSEMIEKLELLWGEGFLSPGGDEEVRRVVRGIDLRDAEVLDIGCGTCGPAVALARDCGARVTAADVEDLVLEKGRAHVARAGLSDRITCVRIEPGPLPFPNARFDCVFSKDALIHVPDKEALYSEILRVLKPAGIFVASDWLAGENAYEDAEFRAFAGRDDLSFSMATAAETAATMRKVGFSDVEAEDRNAWYAERAARELRLLLGELREQAIEMLGQTAYDSWIVMRKRIASVAESGSLRPTDLRGRRAG